MEFGASNSLVIHKALSSFQDDFIPSQLWEENSKLKKSLGFAYRMGKLFLLDFQEDYLIALVQHEIFGHGARFREFGGENNRYSLNPFFPYGNGSGAAFPGSGAASARGDQVFATVIGGVEANQVLNQRLSEQILLGDRIHYRQGLLSTVAPNNLLFYIWIDRFSSNPGDIASYVRRLNLAYPVQGRQHSIERLSRQSLITLLNPLQAYAAWGVVYQYGIQADQYSKVPMIKFGSVKYLPIPGLNLTPFGPEYTLTNHFRWKNRLFVAHLGFPDGLVNQYYRLRAQSINTLDLPHLQTNFHLDLWNQPELSFESGSGPQPNKWGASLKIDWMLNLFPNQSQMDFYLQTGYKTKGFVIGTPLDQGPLLKFGLNFRN